MEFKVLGPLEVSSDDGRPVEIGLPSHRQTVTALLLLADQRPSHHRLVEALWGDELPRNPDIALRKRISEVRRAIQAPRRLETQPLGYHLRAEPGELDTRNFISLAELGRAAMDDGDPAGAARALQQAEGLWREPAWADLPPTPAMQAVADLLNDQRRDAQGVFIDARLAQGQHQAVIGQLRGLVSADPLREHAWAQLMLALYRSGLKTEALAAYARARLITVREYGQDPSPEIEELHRQILAGDPALAPAARPLASLAGATQPAWTPMCQLPATPADFTGRAMEINALAQHLQGRGVTLTVITGPPGTGKTALALHCAHAAAREFPDGMLYVHLGGCAQPRDPQDALAGLLRSLGVTPARVPVAAPEREALYRSLLAHRKVLLVADDATTAAQVRPLLPGTAGSAVLVTSRSPLADLESAQLLGLDEMPAAEAVTLLGRIAGTDTTGPQASAFASIAASCGRLPLALRIAGARLASEPGLTPGVLAASLADEERRLSEMSIGDLSVSERLDTAYAVLGEPARRAFRLASLHPTCDIPDWLIPVLLASPDARGAAEAVARAGLLTAVPASAGEAGRYRMAVLTRAYAAARLAADDLPETIVAAAERLFAGWLELADHADRQLPRHPYLPPPPALRLPSVLPPGPYPLTPKAASAWCGRERANLMTLTEAACVRDHALAAQLADRQFASQCAMADFSDGCQLWELIAAAASRAGDTLAAARARYRLAALSVAEGVRTRQAVRLLTGCLATFGLARDERAMADTHYLLAVCAVADDDPAAARDHAERGLYLGRGADDPRLIFLNMAALGAVLAGMGSAAEGIRLCTDALAIARDLGQPAYEEVARRALAETRIGGHPDAAFWGYRSRVAHGTFPARPA